MPARASRRFPVAVAILLASCGGGGGGDGSAGGGGAEAAVVESVDPERDAEGVPRNATVVVRFRVPMDPSSLAGGHLVLGVVGVPGTVPATVAVAPSGLSATLYPANLLAEGREHQVRLSADARRATGRSVGRPWHSEFRTGEASGPPPPPPPPPVQGGSVRGVGSLEIGRSGHAAAALADGRVAVFGGFSTSSTVTDSIEVFDPATELWTTSAARLGVARGRLSATLLADGRVLLAGGETASLTDIGTDLWEVWDPADDRVSASGTLAERRTGHRAVRLVSGRVLITGGSRTDSSGAPNYSRASAEVFDPGTMTSAAIPSMAVPRAGHEATLLSDGRVLVTGGHGSNRRAEVYDPAAGGFSGAGDMRAARRDHAAGLLADGSVLVTGGGTSAVDRWLPAQNAFVGTSNMGDVRSLHTVLRIANGRLFVAGGEKPNPAGGTLYHTYTEFYDPATGQFLLPGLYSRAPRSGHAAALLPGGDALLVGGKNGLAGAPALRSCDRVSFD